jgi:hypothetical protein
MGLLGNLFGGGGPGGAGTVIKDAAGAVGGLAKDIRTAITGVDADKAAELERLTLELENQAMAMQAKVNEIEAASPRFFVAGWRPAVGWVCVISLAAYYWPRFIIGMALWTVQTVQTKALPPLPELGIWDLLGLLGGILGLGGMRSYEKAKGVQAAH